MADYLRWADSRQLFAEGRLKSFVSIRFGTRSYKLTQPFFLTLCQLCIKENAMHTGLALQPLPVAPWVTMIGSSRTFKSADASLGTR